MLIMETGITINWAQVHMDLDTIGTTKLALQIFM